MISMLYNLCKDMGAGDWVAVVFVFALFIDLTPGIKFNPIMFIVKKAGKAFNNSIDVKIDAFGKEMNDRVDEINGKIEALDTRIDSLEESSVSIARSVDVAEVNRLKLEIMSFSRALSQNQRFSSEQYHTMMDNYQRYHNIIDKYEDLENGKIDVEINVIRDHYEKNVLSGEYLF